MGNAALVSFPGEFGAVNTQVSDLPPFMECDCRSEQETPTPSLGILLPGSWRGGGGGWGVP